MSRPLGALIVALLLGVPGPWPGPGTGQARQPGEPALEPPQLLRPQTDDSQAEEREAGGDIGVAVDGDRISVHAENASLRDVLEAIATEAGLAVSIQGQEDRAVTVRLHRVPLPEALDRILRNDYALAGNRLLVFLGPARTRQAPETGEPATSPGAAPTPQEAAPAPEPATPAAPAPGVPADPAPPTAPGAAPEAAPEGASEAAPPAARP